MTTAHLWCNPSSCCSLRTLSSAVIISLNLSAILILSARLSGFLPHGALVTFVRLQTSQLGLWENEWHCAFLLICLKKVLLQDARKEELLDMVCPRQLEKRLSNFKIPSSILPWMVEAVLVFLFLHFARGRPQLVFASVLPELSTDVRLLVRLGPPRECGCRFCTSWMPFILVTVFFTRFTQREYRGWFFQCLNLNKRVQFMDTYCCFYSRMSSSICNNVNWWILPLFNRFLLFRSQSLSLST